MFVISPSIVTNILQVRLIGWTCVGGKYREGKKVGSGTFGMLMYLRVFSFSLTLFAFRWYLPWSQHYFTNIISEEVAIKIESVKAEHPQLEYKTKVHKTLTGGVGVPFEMVWDQMRLQCDGPRSSWPLPWGSIQLLQSYIFPLLSLVDQLVSRLFLIRNLNLALTLVGDLWNPIHAFPQFDSPRH